MKISRVIVVINEAKEHSKKTAQALKTLLDSESVKQEWLSAIPPRRGLYRCLSDSRSQSADLVIVAGGDGTLIQTAHRFRGSGIPILGINIGYLGFITSLEGRQVRKEMNRILKMDFVVSQRTAVDVSVQTPKRNVAGWAVNDMTIVRGNNPHLISVDAKVGKRPLTQYRCDGLIVATPTGSTAYSLAAGGPIVSPECNVLTITPICPQALTNRSVVVNSTEQIEIALAPASGAAIVQIDGMNLTSVLPGSTILVKTSADRVPIAFLPEINYYDIVGRKLKWTGDSFAKPK